MIRAAIAMCFMGWCFAASAETPARILYIGDSHAHGGLGLAGGLDTLLRQDPAIRISFHAGCGTTSRQWLAGGRAPCDMDRPYLFHDFKGRRGGGKNVSRYIDLRRDVETGVSRGTTLSLVQLGTNFWGWSPPAIVSSVRRLLAELRRGGSECVWIGPPSVDEGKAARHYPGLTNAKIDRVEGAIQQVVGGECFYISSREFTADGSDGVHFRIETGLEWARKVHGVLAQKFLR